MWATIVQGTFERSVITGLNEDWMGGIQLWSLSSVDLMHLDAPIQFSWLSSVTTGLRQNHTRERGPREVGLPGTESFVSNITDIKLSLELEVNEHINYTTVWTIINLKKKLK